MVYAYPTKTSFVIKKDKVKKRPSKNAKALFEYYEEHDVSIVKDEMSGKLVAKVKNK